MMTIVDLPQEEWEMLFLYISRFPEVVGQSVECVIPTGGTIGAKIHTHKVGVVSVCVLVCIYKYNVRLLSGCVFSLV